MMQGAQVDVFGVGERLITSSSSPVFGGVYKLVAVEEPTSGEIIPKIKVSENTTKITNPHFKKLYRYYDNESGKALADELCVYDEVMDFSKPHTISTRMQHGKQKLSQTLPQKNYLYRYLRTASACMNRQRLKILQNTAKTKSDSFGTR